MGRGAMAVTDDAMRRDAPPNESEAARRQRRALAEGRPLRALAPGAFTMIVVAALFCGHMIFGANAPVPATFFAAVWATLGVIAAIGVAGRDDAGVSVAVWSAGVLFLGVLGLGVVQLMGLGEGLVAVLLDGGAAIAPATLDRDATERELVKLASLAPAFACGLAIGRVDERARVFFALFLGAAALYAIGALLTFSLWPGEVLGVAKRFHDDRLTASFLSANTAAAFFAGAGVLALARLLQAAKESLLEGYWSFRAVDRFARRGGLAAVTLLVAASAAAATGSRAGLATFAFGLVLIVAWEWTVGLRRPRPDRAAASLLIAGGAAAAFAAAVAGGLAADRIASLTSGADARAIVLAAHWAAFQHAPAFGFGLGTFQTVNDMVQTPENWVHLERLNAAHNVVLQWLEEAGAVGTALMSAVVAILLVEIAGGVTRRRRHRTWLRAILVLSAVLFLHGMVDYALQTPSMAWQWAVLLGVGCGLSRSREDRQNA